MCRLRTDSRSFRLYQPGRETNGASMSRPDWFPGDMLGLQVPAHAAALREGGCAYLTEAFRAAGALGGDNSVVAVTHFEEKLGGGTGRKLLLSVEYATPGPPTDL